MTFDVGKCLGAVWTRLTSGFSTGVSEKWKKRVCEMYSEPQRYYHTLDHIEEMLQLKAEYRDKLQHECHVDYAVIFHDLVYEPKSPENEEKSAVLFREFAKEVGLSSSVEEAVVEMILATKSHKTTAHQSDTPGSLDLHYFLDLDMAVLGRPQLGYQTYAQQIREEYMHIPEEIFCDKRAEVLASFLGIPYIYATREFRERFESQARRNIEEEIGSLKQRLQKQ